MNALLLPQVVIPDLIRNPSPATPSLWPASKPRLAPAGEVLFFVSPKKSTQKKGDPTVCDPSSLSLRGATCGARSSRGRARTRFAQTIARPHPSGPALLGAYRRGVGSEAGGPDSGRDSGSGDDAQSASSPPRIGIGISAPHPSGRAEERSRKRIRASDSERSESSSTPFSASTAGCPGAQRRGPGPSGRLFFGDFLLAKQKKVTCRRATPGQQAHRAQPTPGTTTKRPPEARK